MPPTKPKARPSSVLFGDRAGASRWRPNRRPPAYAAVSATNVATRTSTSSAAPCSGSSRSSTACANGIPIQTIAKTVTVIETVIPSRSGRVIDERKISGMLAASTIIIWYWSP